MRGITLFYFLLILTACTETRVIREEVEGPDQEEGSGLDPECDLSEASYVVRPIEPNSPHTEARVVSLGDEDVELMSFSIHTCRTLLLEGIFFEFHVYDASPEEEERGPAEDPTCFIIGQFNDDRTGWLTRFADFKLREGGKIFAETPWPNEFRTADSQISPQFHWEPRQLVAGEVVILTLTATVRPENPINTVGFFSFYLGGVIFGPYSWGVDLTHTRLIRVNP